MRHGGEGHLHSDVESRHIEGLEHDLSGIFAVLWRIERRFCLDKYTHCVSSAQQLAWRDTGKVNRKAALTKRK